MRITFDTRSIDDYRKFIRVRECPVYEIVGSTAIIPDEYAEFMDGRKTAVPDTDYVPSSFLFDYQAGISTVAIAKKKFAAFVECGFGKTLIIAEFAKHVASVVAGRPVLIVSPLNVVRQTIGEFARFYPGLPIKQIAAKDLQDFLDNGTGIGITNYEALTQPLRAGRLAGIVVDESSSLKSHYGKWATRILELAAWCEWRLACTGTPAPNDRIEYANHAVFCGAAKTVNEFLASYFVNRGETNNRWEMRPHAVGPFYRNLSHWSIFMSDPSVYGWKDNANEIPPIHVHKHNVPLTDSQRSAIQSETGALFVGKIGGLGSRSRVSQISKGSVNGERIETNKPRFIADLCTSWPDESTLIWCRYNDEQDILATEMPDAVSIDGKTPIEERLDMIDAFKAGQIKTLISKPKILGFGLNLQVATRMVFSGLEDSYETYWQAVKRSNRVGSTRPLNVHLPYTEAEAPMIESVLVKADRVNDDTREQQSLFRRFQLGHS